MADPTLAVVLNPAAGRGRAARLRPRIVEAIRALGLPERIVQTTAPSEATRLAARLASEGVDVVVAVGGDGTVNEVAAGLVAAGRQTALGVIPAGRANDFVRSLGPRISLEGEFASFLRDPPTPVDLGRATLADGRSRIFVNAAGVGLDTAVAERSTDTRLPGATLPYLWAIGSALLHHRNVEMSIDIDGEEIAGRFCSAIVANGRYVGGGMKYVPEADLGDGMLDLALVGDVGKAELIRHVPKLYRGTHVTHPKFSLYRVRRVCIRTAVPLGAQLEAELFGTSPVVFTVEPGALLVAGGVRRP
jgi:diacylglycerol kinase (ATP)